MTERKRSLGKFFWLCAGMTLLSAAVSAGYATQGLILAGSASSYPQYAASRSFALLLGVIYAILSRSTQSVVILAVSMSLVQALDSMIGTAAHDAAKTYGPLVFAAANVIFIVLLQKDMHRNESAS